MAIDLKGKTKEHKHDIYVSIPKNQQNNNPPQWRPNAQWSKTIGELKSLFVSRYSTSNVEMELLLQADQNNTLIFNFQQKKHSNTAG